MSYTISTRLDKKEIIEIESFAKQEDLDKSTFVKKLLHKSLEEYKVERAFKLYKEGKVSLRKAAVLAEKSLWEMLELMKKYDVYLNYDVEEFERDLKNINTRENRRFSVPRKFKKFSLEK